MFYQKSCLGHQLELPNFYPCLTAGGTKQYFTQVKEPDTTPYWKAWTYIFFSQYGESESIIGSNNDIQLMYLTIGAPLLKAVIDTIWLKSQLS